MKIKFMLKSQKKKILSEASTIFMSNIVKKSCPLFREITLEPGRYGYLVLSSEGDQVE